MNLYLTNPGRLKRKDNTLEFQVFNVPEELQRPEEETPLDEDNAIIKKHALPIETIDAVYVFNETRINTKLLNFFSSQKIPVHFFNYYGYYSGAFLPNAEQLSGNLVIAQGTAFKDTEKRLGICKAITEAKIHNILSVMNYYKRKKKVSEQNFDKIIQLKDSLKDMNSPEQVMGIEGLTHKLYYESWQCWLGSFADNFKRKYHPPDTPLNAMISFLNSLLYTACVSEIYRTALYPGISYIHAPQSRRFSLALDLVEPFKPIMVDRLIFQLITRKEISDKDFKAHSNGIMLNEEARKKVLQAWDKQLRVTVKHVGLKRSVSYRQLIRLDCYKLIKHLLEDKPFKPYRMKY
jgi:CRISPR-associated protein Cas1